MTDANTAIRREYERRTTNKTTTGGGGGSMGPVTTEYNPDGSYTSYRTINGRLVIDQQGIGNKITYSRIDQYSREGKFTPAGGEIRIHRGGGSKVHTRNISRESSSAYYPSYQSRNLTPEGGLRVLAEAQKRGFYGDRKVASSAGPMPGRMQPVVTAMHERNRVEFGGGMGGSLRPDAALAIGFGNLFERNAARAGATAAPSTMTVGGVSYDTRTGETVAASKTEAPRSPEVYESPLPSPPPTPQNNNFVNEAAPSMLVKPAPADKYSYTAGVGWGGAYEREEAEYADKQTPSRTSDESIVKPGWQGEAAFYTWAGALGGAVVGGPVGAVIGAGGGAVGYGVGKTVKYVAEKAAAKAEPIYTSMPDAVKMGYKGATLPFQITYRALKSTVAPDMTPKEFVGGVAEAGGFVVGSSAAAGKLAGYAETKFIGSSRVMTKGIGEQRITPMGEYTAVGYEASGKGVSGSRYLPKNKFLYEAKGTQLGRTLSPNKFEAADVATVTIGGKTPLGSTYVKSVRVAGQYSGETAPAETVRYMKLGVYDKGNLIGVQNTVKIPESTLVAGQTRTYDIVKPGVYRPRGTNTVGAVTYSKTSRLVGDVDYSKTLTYQRTSNQGLLKGRRVTVSRSDWAVANQPAPKMGGGSFQSGVTVQKTQVKPMSIAVSDVAVKQGVRSALGSASKTVSAQTAVRFGRAASQTSIVAIGVRKASRQELMVMPALRSKRDSATMAGLVLTRGSRQAMVTIPRTRSAQTTYTPSLTTSKSGVQSLVTSQGLITTQSSASGRSSGVMNVVSPVESYAPPLLSPFKTTATPTPRGLGIVAWPGRGGAKVGGRRRTRGRWTNAYIMGGAEALGLVGVRPKRKGGKKRRRR